jgi:chromosome segregation ATPase
MLKEIFITKQNELTISLNKVDELTKQNKNELEKLKQELITRNKLNEQQSHKIAYQRELFTSKQEELNQLDHRIEELQQNLIKKKTTSNTFQKGLNSVKDTLNNINIAEIEKRMVQLANSFNSINEHERISVTSSPTKVCS